MADRTVSVRLQAIVGPYSAAMAKATKDTRDFQQQIANGKKETQQFGKQLGTGLIAAGGAAVVGLGLATSAAMDFDRAMSEVSAVAGATSAQMGQLRDAAIEAGAATSFSATEAATAQAELVKAGISVEDVLGGGLTGALDLAAAGTLDLAQAAEIAAQAMNIFNLGGEDVTHIADVLAAGANKSAADVAQLGDALRQGGLVAAQTGLSMEETTAALAAFSDNALIGSDAGTSLKTMLQRLTPQSKEAAALMEQLGFSAYDAQGNFIGLEGLASELREALSDMSNEQRNAAMSTLFGSDAVRAANILYNQGAGGIATYVTAVNDQGAAADMAAEKLNNLSGDIEQLSGSIETQLIEGGSKATGMLRGLTQGATDMVNGFGALPGTVQTVGIGLGAVAGAGALAGGAFLLLTPRIIAARVALADLAVTAPAASRGIGLLGTTMGVVSAALPGLMVGMTLWGNIQARGTKISQDFVDSLPDPDSIDARRQRINGMIAEYERLQRVAASGGGIGKFLREVGQDVNPFAPNTISDAEAATHSLAAAIREEQEAYERLTPALHRAMEMTGLTEAEVVELADSIGVDLSAAGFDGTAAIAGVVAEANRLAEGVPEAERMTMSLEEQQEAAEAAAEALVALGDQAGAFTDALDGWEAAYDAAETAAREHGEAQADAANDATSAQIDAIRRGADEQATALQREADDHIRAAGLTGQAAEDVRRAAQDKADAVRSSADDEAAALDDSRSSWEDYVGEVTVSTEELIAQWEAQVEALDDWRSNLTEIALRGGGDVADILADMGPEGAALAEQFADMTAEEFERAGDLFVRAMTDGGAEAGQALKTQLDIAAAIGNAGGLATAQQIAAGLGVGIEEVRRVAGEMGVALREELDFHLRLAAATAGIFGGIGAVAGVASLQPQHRALGGPVYRAAGGPSGTDTVPAWLTPGEFVIRKSAVDAWGLPLMQALNAGRLTPALALAPAAMAPASAPASSGGGINMTVHAEGVSADEVIRRANARLGWGLTGRGDR